MRRGLFRLELIRSFTLSRENSAALPVSNSGQRLLALLALSTRPQKRATVAETLWPDTPRARSNGNLRSTLWRLRQIEPNLVDCSQRLINLGPAIRVDVRELEQRARRLLLGEITDAFELQTEDFVADLLPGWYEDWLTIERERFRQLRLHALEAMCQTFARAGRYSEAIDAGLAAVESEPLRESAHRVLIRAYLAEGNLHEAVRQFARCRQLLMQELNVEPAFSIRSLMEAGAPRATPAITS